MGLIRDVGALLRYSRYFSSQMLLYRCLAHDLNFHADRLKFRLFGIFQSSLVSDTTFSGVKTCFFLAYFGPKIPPLN